MYWRINSYIYVEIKPMKRIVLFILFLVNGGILFTQTFNYAHHLGAETTYNMVGINSKSFYLEKL